MRTEARAPIFICAVILISLNCVTAQAQEERLVGIVESVSGGWYQAGFPGKTLIQGSSVLASQKIVARKNNRRNDRIVIALLDDQKIERVCRANGACGAPIALPSTVRRPQRSAAPEPKPEQVSLYTRFHRVLITFLGNRRIYIPLVTRGEGIDIKENVVQAVNGQIDLSPVLSGTLDATYQINIEKVKESGSSISLSQIKEFEYRWDSSRPAPIQATGIEPGLYNIRVQGLGNGAPKEAWVLVSSRERYEMNKKFFEEAKKITDAWDPGIFPSARPFLRAYLAYLYEQDESSR